MTNKRGNMTEKSNVSNAKKKADLKAEHGAIADVELAGTVYYFRQPSLPEYQRCMDGMAKDKGAGVSSLKELLYACSVGDDVDSAISSLPAAITPIGNAILEMGGSEVQVNISKG